VHWYKNYFDLTCISSNSCDLKLFSALILFSFRLSTYGSAAAEYSDGNGYTNLSNTGTHQLIKAKIDSDWNLLVRMSALLTNLNPSLGSGNRNMPSWLWLQIYCCFRPWLVSACKSLLRWQTYIWYLSINCVQIFLIAIHVERRTINSGRRTC